MDTIDDTLVVSVGVKLSLDGMGVAMSNLVHGRTSSKYLRNSFSNSIMRLMQLKSTYSFKPKNFFPQNLCSLSKDPIPKSVLEGVIGLFLTSYMTFLTLIITG